MKKTEKNDAIIMKAFAYYSGFGGLELKKIEYGIDDYIIYTDGAFTGKKTAHKSKVYNDSNGAYFRYYNNKIRFSDCIRAGF